MEEELGFDLAECDEDELPFVLSQPKPQPTVRGVKVQRHATSLAVDPEIQDNGSVRVTPIGEAFRDTLLAPPLNGGIEQVVRLWRTHAGPHLDAIVPAISATPEKIARVRAGYLLEEVLGVRDTRIATWAVDAQRGSSRKLDPSAPYIGRYSPRWMISINVDDATLPATVA